MNWWLKVEDKLHREATGVRFTSAPVSVMNDICCLLAKPETDTKASVWNTLTQRVSSRVVEERGRSAGVNPGAAGGNHPDPFLEARAPSPECLAQRELQSLDACVLHLW